MKKIMERTIRWCVAALVSVVVLGLSGMTVEAAASYTNMDAPFVTYTPDPERYGWTVDAPIPEGEDRWIKEDSTHSYWYDKGTEVLTGIPWSVKEPGVGQHRYTYDRMGLIPIYKWFVIHEKGCCIHRGSDDYWYGIYNSPGDSVCHQAYFSGWQGICADCGGWYSHYNIYMDKKYISQLYALDNRKAFYYLCPDSGCRHLEQTEGLDAHSCQDISYNMYMVVYEPGLLPGQYRGSKAPTYHMYNNETMYDGLPVMADTHLSENVQGDGFFRDGYKVVGWSYTPGGVKAFDDGEEILNLSEYDYNIDEVNGTVILYAVWAKVDGTLEIDPNGGRYTDNSDPGHITENDQGITSIKAQYNNIYSINMDELKPPKGYEVSFDTKGGSAVNPMEAEIRFGQWKKSYPFHGTFSEDFNKYRFSCVTDGKTDRLTAVWKSGYIILPAPTRPGYSFGGWFEDVGCTKPVGFGGDNYTPKADTTLYAKWVELVLYSKENYTDNDRKGAVDLSWSQPDDLPKGYKLYESKDGVNFSLIYGAKETTNKNETERDFSFKGVQEVYTVPYSGFYEISASGAQGANYGSFNGGLGGRTTAKMYFTAGEKLTVTVGGNNGYNGGGAATKYGNGGGATTIVSDRRGVLMIAGGGGGATERDHGGPGGFSDSLRADNVMAGEDGTAGGGGGLVGGTTGGCYEEFGFKGGIQTFKAPCAGNYTLEVWGARGGHAAGQIAGGFGGYSYGEIQLQKGQVLYVVVGGAGTDCNVRGPNDYGDPDKDVIYAGGYNGGGTSSTVRYYNGSGGGATHIATASGELKNLVNNKSSVLIVAGGGGGASYDSNTTYGFGGAGGGKNGGAGTEMGKYSSAPWIGTGGTQTEGGTNKFKIDVFDDTRAGFGYGSTKPYIHNSAGGGGGWYGGGSGGGWCGAGGGSGYIGGVLNGRMESGLRDGHGMAKISCPGKAGGGSNYVNEACATYFQSEPGVQNGNGKVHIKAVAVGYMNELYLNGVAAPDLAAPDKISTQEEDLILEADGDRAVKVTFTKPKDNGTPYWYKAESYKDGTDVLLCTSNITTETLTTGTACYFYIFDSTPERIVTGENADNKGTPLWSAGNIETVRVILPEDEMYLHVAAVDVAGNVGPTADIKIKLDGIAWTVATNQVAVTDSINGKEYGTVYQKDVNTFYVRADGEGPFMLSYQSYLYGDAREDYQIDYQIFDVVTGAQHQRYSTRIPYSIPLSLEAALPVSAFVREMSGDSVLKDAMNTAAVRKRDAKDNDFFQAFTVPKSYHGQTLVVTPVAGATFGEEIVYSEWSEDTTHAVSLIADGEAPIISGVELLENKQLIQRLEEEITLHLTAVDALSGVGEFWLEIVNLENHGRRTYLPGEDGSICLEITEEETLFSGDICVTAYAVDKVGNERRLSYGVTEFALATEIERILTPNEPVFKCGESGILTITVWGYADRVEVEFPEEFTNKNPELNMCFDYTDSPQYMREERLQFMVPLEIPLNKQYTVIVRAYKGEKQLEEYPSLSTIEVGGSVLEELRTRLR